MNYKMTLIKKIPTNVSFIVYKFIIEASVNDFTLVILFFSKIFDV